MRALSLFKRGMLCGALTALAVVGPRPLTGQTPAAVLNAPQFGVGYVASAPDLMGGISGYVILPRMGGIGLYADVKFDLDDPSGDLAFREGLTPAEVESELEGVRYIKRESSWRSFNAALVRPLNPSLIAYGGVGYSRRTSYRLYEQVTFDVGQALMVKDPGGDEGRVNLLAGVLLRLSSTVSSQLGIETQPRGLTVGVSLRLPRW